MFRLSRPSSAVASIALTAGLIAVAAGVPAPADDAAGWVPLFNGKDLTGWKLHPDANKRAVPEIVEKTADGKRVGYDGKTADGKAVTLWRVEDGLLIGAGPMTHLYTDGADYSDFRFRVTAKINDKGNSGLFFRSGYRGGVPKGYEVQINATHGDPIKTGSLYPNGEFGLGKFRDVFTVMNTAPHKPDEWFTEEVVADGPKLTVFVNGKQTVEWTDPEHRFKSGHFALQGHDPGTVVTFKSVEYKPLKK